MIRFQNIHRILWLLTGVASIPFAVTTLFEEGMPFFHLLVLSLGVVIFDGYLVPFLLLHGAITFWKKTLIVGVNLIFTTFWIFLTGGSQSVYFMHLYYLPILVVTIFGGFWASLTTAFSAIVLSLGMYYASGPSVAFWKSSYGPETIILLLMATVLGYLLQVEKEQNEEQEQLAQNLQMAYDQLSFSHQQLKDYMGIIQGLNRELEQFSITDELTGLFNYRYFHSWVDRELLQPRFGSMCALMLDIDFFKRVNDTFGHQSGNQVLKRLAAIIRSILRESDLIARYGGEEFVMVLPGSDGNSALQVAQRVRKAMEEEIFLSENGQEFHITVSIGISVFPFDSGNKDELISHADLALYRAKESGRNKVCLFRDENRPQPIMSEAETTG